MKHLVKYLFILSFLLGSAYSFPQQKTESHKYLFKINVKNLEGTTITTAKITVTQVKSGLKQHVIFSSDPGCYMVDVETGSIVIKVENAGYDSQDRHRVVYGPQESELIVIGKLNSNYIFIDSGKHPILDFNNKIGVFAARHHNQEQLSAEIKKEMAASNLKPNEYLLSPVDMGSEFIYYIDVTKKITSTQRQLILARLRKNTFTQQCGPIVIENNYRTAVLRNYCSVKFSAETDSLRITQLLKSVGATDWELGDYGYYSVAFPKGFGLEVLKSAEKLTQFEEVRSVTNSLLETSPRVN